MGSPRRAGRGAGLTGPLLRAGFTTTAAALTALAALAAESDRRGRDEFGQLTDPDPAGTRGPGSPRPPTSPPPSGN